MIVSGAGIYTATSVRSASFVGDGNGTKLASVFVRSGVPKQTVLFRVLLGSLRSQMSVAHFDNQPGHDMLLP